MTGSDAVSIWGLLSDQGELNVHVIDFTCLKKSGFIGFLLTSGDVAAGCGVNH